MSLIQNEGGVSTRMPMKFAALRENGNSFRKGRITPAVARGCGPCESAGARANQRNPCAILRAMLHPRHATTREPCHEQRAARALTMRGAGSSVAWAVSVTLGSAGWPSAMAAGEDARALAAGCLACHQPVAGALLPALDGPPRDSIATKFRALRDGTQPGTVMPQLAKGYTDAQIDAIARYFAAQPPRR